MGGYSVSRHKWALKMQDKWAMSIYKHHFEVGDDAIRETDADGFGGDSTAKDLDFSGIDKRIRKPSGETFHLAQRFRPGRGRDVDFSLRYSLPNSNLNREYERLMASYRSGGDYPQRYAFGIGHGVGKEDALEHGFGRFYIFSTGTLLKKIDQAVVKPVTARPTDKTNGIGGLYYRVGDLRKHFCVRREWDYDDLKRIGGAK